MTHNLPEKDDAPWLDTTYDGFMTHEEMLEEAAKREEDNVLIAKISDEDYQKVQAVLEREQLAKKTFEELTKNEKIKLALEELAAIVMGGQDGEEYYNSVKFIKEVLESLRTLEEPSHGITQHPRDAL